MSTEALYQIGGHPKGFLATLRRDAWWLGPAVTLAVFITFIIYATWAGFQGNHYFVGAAEGFGGYLSPFYSPVLFVQTGVPGAAPLHHAWLGALPSWWPAAIPFSPTFLIIPFPLSFRFTCYYYRKAYYRAFTGTPPACAVGARPQGTYKGETSLLIIQNLHRYALYAALAFIPILAWDAFQGFFRGGKFGVGVGSLLLTLNVTLIASYTFGCHSWRHLIGGRRDTFSDSKARLGIWKRSTWFNERHMQFAWASLITVGLTDVYIRLVSSGVIHDINTWG